MYARASFVSVEATYLMRSQLLGVSDLPWPVRARNAISLCLESGRTAVKMTWRQMDRERYAAV